MVMYSGEVHCIMGISLSKEFSQNTHNLVSGCVGDGGGSLLQVGLQQPDEWRYVSCAFPQDGLQEVRKQSHVGGGN